MTAMSDCVSGTVPGVSHISSTLTVGLLTQTFVLSLSLLPKEGTASKILDSGQKAEANKNQHKKNEINHME